MCLSFAPPVVRMTHFSTTHIHSEANPFIHIHAGAQKTSTICSLHGQIFMFPLPLRSARRCSHCWTISGFCPSVQRDSWNEGGLMGMGGGLVSDVAPLLVLPVSSFIVHRLHPLANQYAHVSRVLAPDCPSTRSIQPQCVHIRF